MSGINWSIAVVGADTGSVLYDEHPDAVPSNGHPDGVLYDEHPDAVLRTASIGKVLLLFRAAELIERGTLDPARLLTRTAADAVADSGVWQHLSVESLSVLDLCELIGMASDNLATNVLLREVGLEGVASTAARRGMKATMLHDRVRDERRPSDPATLSSGTAAELAHLMSGLHHGAAAGGAVTGRVHRWLGKGVDLSQVASAWGLDPLAHDFSDLGLRLVNKTGTDDGVRADVGVLTGPERSVAYAVLANWDGSDIGRRRVLARQRALGEQLAAAVRGEAATGFAAGNW